MGKVWVFLYRYSLVEFLKRFNTSHEIWNIIEDFFGIEKWFKMYSNEYMIIKNILYECVIIKNILYEYRNFFGPFQEVYKFSGASESILERL